MEVSREMIEEKTSGGLRASGTGSCQEKGARMKPEGFSTRRMRSYAGSPATAAQLSEKNALGANRREEYRKVAEIFLRCKDMDEAHGCQPWYSGWNVLSI